MKNWKTTLFLVFCIIFGFGLLLYPGFSESWNSRRQSRAIAQYKAAVETGDTAEQEVMLARAREYNKMIEENGVDLLPEHFDSALYESELSMDGTQTMCYLDIPRVNCFLPVYHGTSESVLQVAVGHLEGTSLPVGGEGTHCVLSGHRGLPSARLFTDLDKLQLGDTFSIYTLNEQMDYLVEKIRVIEPYDLTTIQIEPGADLVTLITCTPYGINTQRLSITGRRIDSIAAAIGPGIKTGRFTSDATQIEPSGAVPYIAVPLTIAVLLFLYLRERKKKARERLIRTELKDLGLELNLT